MSDWPKSAFVQELFELARLDRLTLKRSVPLDHLSSYCPRLVSATPPTLRRQIDNEDGQVWGMRQLLQYVAFTDTQPEVRAAGDLLGLSNDKPGDVAELSTEEVRTIFDGYSARSDAPKTFERFGREVRQLLAVRHFGYSITWIGEHRGQRQVEFFERFVDRVCEFLENRNGNLAPLERSLGLRQDDPASAVEISDLSPDSRAEEPERALAQLAESLPEASEPDKYRLAVLLNFNVSLTQKVCAYIGRSSVDVHEASQILAVDPGAFLDAVALSRKDVMPTKWLTNAIHALSAENADCLRLFDLLACVHHRRVPTEYLMAFLLRCSLVDNSNLTHGLMLLHRATEPLEELGLVYPSHAFVSTNPLVQRLWRHLRNQEILTLLKDALDWHRSIDVEVRNKMGIDLFAAGWSPATWAGTMLCNSVSSSLFYDYFYDDCRAESSGRLGAEWLLATNALWERYLQCGGLNWAMYLMRALIERKERGLPVALDLFSNRTTFQVREFLDAFKEGRALDSIADVSKQATDMINNILDGRELPPEGSSERDLVIRELVASQMDPIVEAMKADVSTDLGTFSMSSAIPGWSEPKQLREGSLLRE